MRPIVKIAGKKFGRLTVIKLAYVKKGRGAFWLCKCDCGKNKVVCSGSLRSGMTHSCGCLKREMLQKRNKTYIGENNPFWKGGRRLTKAGYVTLRMPAHPNAQSDGRVKEHVYVMSKHLGRPLLEAPPQSFSLSFCGKKSCSLYKRESVPKPVFRVRHFYFMLKTFNTLLFLKLYYNNSRDKLKTKGGERNGRL